jgi:hypothetical protein
MRRQRSIEEKFWPNVTQTTDCWEWTSTLNDNGYGVVFHQFDGSAKQKQYRAHRISFLLHHGYMPDGILMHTCDNRRCVNPQHVVVGTLAENVADMCQKGRNRWRALIGEQHGNAILTWDIVNDIRAQYARGGITQTELARQYDIGQTTVAGIVLYKSWKSH